MRKIEFWINRLESLENKENLTFEAVYMALGSIADINEKITYVRKFAELDPDFRKTLREYARKEYRRTGDNEIEIEWIKAIHAVEGEIDIQKSRWDF